MSEIEKAREALISETGALLAASYRDGYEEGKADTTALARRLAENLSRAIYLAHNKLPVPPDFLERWKDALAEARKAGLIE